MKAILAISFSLMLINASPARADRKMETVNVKTLVTCQQTDGDLWYEVGVTEDKNGYYQLLLVKHDGDKGSITLMQRHYARATQKGTAIVFTSIEDWVNFKLSVAATGRNSYGRFIYQEDGMLKSLKDERMDCYPNSTISYEIEAGLEPRMSVGN